MFDVKPVTSKKSTDCGAACMVSFLDYYGVTVTLDDMIKECKVSINGCSAKDLMVVGRNHGLDMKSFQMDAEEAARVDRPSICWWKYAHWVICCGMDDRGQVVIMNPSRGRYAMSESLFRAFYSGVEIFNGEPPELPEE